MGERLLAGSMRGKTAESATKKSAGHDEDVVKEGDAAETSGETARARVRPGKGERLE